MVRKNIHKINIIVLALLCVISLPALLALADATATATCTTNASNLKQCEDSTVFQVKVNEIMTVKVTPTDVTNTGEAGSFLRNKINVQVTSNNGDGFVASMYSKTSTSLTNPAATSNNTIPTLETTQTVSSFPTNFWGYSLDDTTTGITSANYSALSLSSSPISLINIEQSKSGINNKDVYFGAKADATKPAGTYTGTVVISVVSGTTTNDNPVVPVNPVGPNDDDQVAEYHPSPAGNPNGNNGTTTYTTYGNDGSITTEVTAGDNRSAYTSPQGVVDKVATTTNIGEGTPLATGLAVTAGVAATAGVFFFILAKRKKDDDDEEEEQ